MLMHKSKMLEKIVEKNYQALKVLLLSSKNVLKLELKNQPLW